MEEAVINPRLKNIIRKLCGERDYITVTVIAKDLEVSSRTILRELPAVEKWLKKIGFKLETKAGVGVKIDGSSEDREKILALLTEGKEEKFYSPRERQTIITSELLQNREPVKLYNFTRTLNVTEGTISNDLDKVEDWLKEHGLALKRKQGVGICIEGEEDNIRKGMIDLIYENINESFLLNLIRNNISKDPEPANKTELIARSRLLNLVDKSTIQQLERLVRNAEGHIGHRLADSAFVGLIVHLAIALQRIKKNEDIVMDPRFMEELESSREYAVALLLAQEITRLFGIEIPKDEIGYITMHIKGSKNVETDEGSADAIANDELVRLAKDIIECAENQTGRFLSQNDKLLAGLVNHLGPAISRLKMNLEIRNPLLKEIREHYPELMKVAGQCVNALEKYTGMVIPEAEIAYIAMHLGAAVEKSDTTQKRKFRAAIACATGIGTSRLLATRIEKEYDNIQIVDVVSTLGIDKEWLRGKGVEFIVSTVPIEECPVPVVIVTPLLLEEDKAKISVLVNQLKGAAPVLYPNKKKPLALKDKMQALNNYGNAITGILDNFFVIEDTGAENTNDLIGQVCRQVTRNRADAEKLDARLKAREEMGGTFIAGYGILLLHCRTEAVDRLHFGVIKAGDGLYRDGGGEEKVELGLVIIAPENSDKYLLETISHVNGMLIEKPGFIERLKTGTKEEALEDLSNILEEFYNMKSVKYFSE